MPKINRIEERRKSQRICCSLDAKYKHAGARLFKKAIACQNLGGWGLKLLLKEPLDVKDAITVLLYLRKNAKPVTAYCEVAWCMKNEKGKFNVGMKFLKLRERQCFINFLCDALINSSIEERTGG